MTTSCTSAAERHTKRPLLGLCLSPESFPVLLIGFASGLPALGLLMLNGQVKKEFRDTTRHWKHANLFQICSWEASPHQHPPAQRGPDNLLWAGESPLWWCKGKSRLSPVLVTLPLLIRVALGVLVSLIEIQSCQWLLSPSINFLMCQLFWDYALSGPRAIPGPLCLSHPATAAFTDSSCSCKARRGRQE